MKQLKIILALAALSAVPVLCAKTMVLFTSGNDSLRNLSSLDSIKFSGASGSRNFIMHRGTGNTVTALSTIDSIRFYDGAAVFTPEMLYNGATASPMILGTGKAFITLDLRNFTSGFSGEMSTDPIDCLDKDNAGVSALAVLSNATVATRTVIPAGAAVTLYYKTGNNYFNETGWTAWTVAPGLNCNLTGLSGRYLKLRYTMTTASKSALPQIAQAAVYANYSSLPQFVKTVTASSFVNERIVTGAYPFGWESRTTAAIQNFTTGAGLAAVVAAKTSEFDKIYALTDWCARKARGSTPSSPYPWDITRVYGSGTIYGHCMSYAEVLITGLTGLGWYARHWAIQEYTPGNRNHEVVEVWCNALKKWVYQDPSLDTYYANPTTGQPLSILEMHDINMTNGAITNVDGKYHYGVYTDPYNWQTLQGYKTTGYMMMTTRNNFHSQPSPAYSEFGNGVCGYNTFPSYIDSRTLTCDNTMTKFSGRQRDFWYTLNQASIKAKQSSENQLTLEFGNSQPFFKQYMVSVDGGAFAAATSPYVWTLHSGSNRLVVAPEDNWATRGLQSEIQVSY